MLRNIADGVKLVIGENDGRPPYCNGLFIDDDIKILVDTGSGREPLEKLLEQVGHVDVVINSHYHLDHIAHNSLFKESEFWAHEYDAPALRSKEDFCRFVGIDDKFWTELLKAFPVPDDLYSTEVDKVLTDGQWINTGRMQWQVVHLPGHTPGHIGLYQPERGILFTGDIDLSSFGPWYGNKSSDIQQFLQSIERVKQFQPNTVVTSHGKVVTEKIEFALDRYAGVVFEREQKITNALKERPMSLAELVPKCIIHPHQSKQAHEFFEGMMLEKHLGQLLEQDRVECSGGLYHVK